MIKMNTDWDIRGKTVFITGATDGIGRGAALQLAKFGARIVFTARTKEKAEALKADLVANGGKAEYLLCDLASFSSIKNCVTEFFKSHDALHVLINNAGVMPLERKASSDGIELNMAVNYFAPVLLTELLLPLLTRSKPARIIEVTSSMHNRGVVDLADLKGIGSYDRYAAYSTSKLSLMLYTLDLAKLLPEGVVANAVHPGWIRTKLARGALGKSSILAKLLLPLKMRTPAYGARSIVYLATDPSAGGLNGTYVIKKEPVEPSVRARDEVLGRQLVKETKKILAPYL